MIQLLNYSERAIALQGNTQVIKDTLKQLGGRYNPYLKHPETGQQFKGWIFSKSKQLQVETLINNTSIDVPVNEVVKFSYVPKIAPIVKGEQLVSVADLTLEYSTLNFEINKENLAKEYLSAMYDKQELKTVYDAIGVQFGYITNDSFCKYGDKNKITIGIAKAYFRKFGKGVDIIAMDAELALYGEYQGNITTDDVIGYILDNPNGVPNGRNERAKLINECFCKLTGKQINKKIAQSIVDTYTAIRNELSQKPLNDLNDNLPF